MRNRTICFGSIDVVLVQLVQLRELVISDLVRELDTKLLPTCGFDSHPL